MNKAISLTTLCFAFLFSCIPQLLSAQQHFTYTANTGSNCTVVIPVSSNPLLNNVPIAVGDEIGVFSGKGLCVGAIVWQAANTAITVWGDDPFTTAVDGLVAGDTMFFRVWHKTDNKEHTGAVVKFSSGSAIYATDGIEVVSSFTVSPSAVKGAQALYALQSSLSVYPNPVHARMNVHIASGRQGTVRLSVFNILGQEVAKYSFTKSDAGNFDVMLTPQQEWGRGVFICKCEIDGEKIIKKFVILDK